MKKISTILFFIFAGVLLNAQTNPAITTWLQNNTVYGSHYVSGNYTPITDTDLANGTLHT